MKSLRSNRLLSIILVVTVLISACKKDEPEEVTTDSTPVQQLSSDDKALENNLDEAMVDAGGVLSGTMGYKMAGLPCNAILDSVYIINDTVHYHVTYNGLNCIQTKQRSGVIIIKLKNNTQWFLAGAFMTMEFHDYRVTNVYTGNSMLINGHSKIENISGGVLALLGNGLNSLIHRNTAHIRVAFNAGISREWHLTKRLVYSGEQGNLVMTVEGFGTANNYQNLLSWGQERDGKVFYTQVAEAVVFRERCNWVPFSGSEIYSIPADDLKASVKFGFNNQNNPVMGNECPTRYRLIWQQHGHSGTIFLPLAGNE